MGNSQFRKKFFRTRKQILSFENFRVHSLVSINALNFHIMIAMTFLAIMTRKAATNALLKSGLDAARSIKDTVHFLYYRISYGIAEILKYARVGIRDWFKPKRTDQNQLHFRLSAWQYPYILNQAERQDDFPPGWCAFLIKMGNSQWLLSKRREPGRRYGGVLLFAETQDTVTLRCNTFLASELPQKI